MAPGHIIYYVFAPSRVVGVTRTKHLCSAPARAKMSSAALDTLVSLGTPKSPVQRVMIVVWGTRGDVQPALSLALRLQGTGRKVLIFATPPGTDMAKGKGIEVVEAKENVAAFIEELFGKAGVLLPAHTRAPARLSLRAR